MAAKVESASRRRPARDLRSKIACRIKLLELPFRDAIKKNKKRGGGKKGRTNDDGDFSIRLFCQVLIENYMN